MAVPLHPIVRVFYLCNEGTGTVPLQNRKLIQMPLKTTLEQLEEVQAAITEVMTSQELGGPNGKVVRAQLDALNTREEKLLERYNAEQGTCGRDNLASFR
jgi:hypothetical protein